MQINNAQDLADALGTIGLDYDLTDLDVRIDEEQVRSLAVTDYEYFEGETRLIDVNIDVIPMKQPEPKPEPTMRTQYFISARRHNPELETAAYPLHGFYPTQQYAEDHLEEAKRELPGYDEYLVVSTPFERPHRQPQKLRDVPIMRGKHGKLVTLEQIPDIFNFALDVDSPIMSEALLGLWHQAHDMLDLIQGTGEASQIHDLKDVHYKIGDCVTILNQRLDGSWFVEGNATIREVHHDTRYMVEFYDDDSKPDGLPVMRDIDPRAQRYPLKRVRELNMMQLHAQKTDNAALTNNPQA